MGIVFNIQRGCLDDGPGIRTTVFLKGCGLRCRWCHNPEAVSPKPQLFFNGANCVLCGRCAQVCAHQVHGIEKGAHSVAFERCLQCGECINVCDHEGLRIVGAEMTVEDVMREVAADLDFYRQSGGGTTLSGGEPLLQPEFATELLTASRNASINTCVETSGFVPASVFKSLLPLIDVLLFDYKLSDPVLHKEYSGASNDLILRNLQIAYNAGTKIILRCPIIPSVNDTAEHFQAIAGLSQNYPRLAGIELLPYHAMGQEKARAIGCAEAEFSPTAVDQQHKEKWMDKLRDLGCECATIR